MPVACAPAGCRRGAGCEPCFLRRGGRGSGIGRNGLRVGRDGRVRLDGRCCPALRAVLARRLLGLWGSGFGRRTSRRRLPGGGGLALLRRFGSGWQDNRRGHLHRRRDSGPLRGSGNRIAIYVQLGSLALRRAGGLGLIAGQGEDRLLRLVLLLRKGGGRGRQRQRGQKKGRTDPHGPSQGNGAAERPVNGAGTQHGDDFMRAMA